MAFVKALYVVLFVSLTSAVVLVVLLAAGVVHPKGEGHKHIERYKCNDYNDPGSALPLCPPPVDEKRLQQVAAREEQAARQARLAEQAALKQDHIRKQLAAAAKAAREAKEADEEEHREYLQTVAEEKKAEDERRRQEAAEMAARQRRREEQEKNAQEEEEARKAAAAGKVLQLPGESQECETATLGSVCFDHVDWAMNSGMSDHPAWYDGLTPQSTFEQFQALLHSRGEGKCPSPCSKKASPEPTLASAKPDAKQPRLAEKSCHTVFEGETCFKQVQWAKTVGIREHPEWYAASSLTASSSFEDFQEHIRSKNEIPCPKPCRLTRHFLQMSMA